MVAPPESGWISSLAHLASAGNAGGASAAGNVARIGANVSIPCRGMPGGIGAGQGCGSGTGGHFTLCADSRSLPMRDPTAERKKAPEWEAFRGSKMTN